MRTRVQRWGNSLAVRIPCRFADQLGLVANSVVDVRLEPGEMVVRPVVGPRYSLDELLAGIAGGNLHREMGTSEPQGNESW